MNCRRMLFLAAVCFSLSAHAQLWAPLLNSQQAIDWSNAGVGGIPARPVICANLTPSATLDQINRALASCPRGQTVYLAAGTYSIAGNINVPSEVTLRGAGANLTILNATGRGGGNVINLGTASVSYSPLSIKNGATAGSTSLLVSNGSGITVGKYLAIAETNDPEYVSSNGSEGNCRWCDGWTKDGSLARGQIVQVTAVRGDTISISPALYSTFTHTPIAVPFNMSATRAGVEDLQVYANNSGYGANFRMSACAYCWIRGVESNYTDGDHVRVYWGFHDEIRDSYFSNAYLHRPGQSDSDIQIGWKTTASLVENNIIERTHVSIMLVWGAAGNVISYNYTTGEFDNGSIYFLIGGIDFHGAHPQFNLLEGNVISVIFEDSIWGTSSHTTAFRNWVVGTSRICDPMSGRGVVKCSGTEGHYAFSAARPMLVSYLATKNNFIGNVVGSEQMQSLVGYHKPLAQVASIEYPAVRSYDKAAYGWVFGYGETNDDGTGEGCAGGVGPCHRAGTSRSQFLHGNYNNIDLSLQWAPGVSHKLPASFYLAAKPGWWGEMPFPATGPDVNGGIGAGGHSFGNPAQACYTKVMRGSDGGAGSPLTFNADACYASGAKR